MSVLQQPAIRGIAGCGWAQIKAKEVMGFLVHGSGFNMRIEFLGNCMLD